MLLHPLPGQSQYQSFSFNTSGLTNFIAIYCHLNEQECLQGKLPDVPSHAPWPPPFVPSNAKASLYILHIQVSTSMHIAEHAIMFCTQRIAQRSLVYAITIENAALPVRLQNTTEKLHTSSGGCTTCSVVVCCSGLTICEHI